MGLNETPSGNRVHIGFFGCRNAGKSSVVNAVTGQDMAVVSDVKGTTTDPVKKAMELLPIGPVVIIDTPGIDDEGELGQLRVQKTKQILASCDVAVLIVDSVVGMNNCDRELIAIFKERKIPYIVAYNKSDIGTKPELYDNGVSVSAKTGDGIDALKNKIGALAVKEDEKRLLADLIKKGDTVVLVIPIDEAAPKGRIILPQQQALRDILDVHATAVVVRETELNDAFEALSQKPALVVTDSQAFKEVAKATPEDVTLTSFSILMARYKGFLDFAVDGVSAIDRLKDGDAVLIAEGCTHHRQCGDIGTVKIPMLIRKYTGANVKIETSSGGSFPEELSKYALIIHCGGCMLNEREVISRAERAKKAGIPMTNFGTAIAYMNGILKRSLEPFPHLYNKI